KKTGQDERDEQDGRIRNRGALVQSCLSCLSCQNLCPIAELSLRRLAEKIFLCTTPRSGRCRRPCCVRVALRARDTRGARAPPRAGERGESPSARDGTSTAALRCRSSAPRTRPPACRAAVRGASADRRADAADHGTAVRVTAARAY